jgi:protease-4
MWWTVGIVIGLAMLVGSCTLPFAALVTSSKSGSVPGTGDAVGVIRVEGVIAGGGRYSDYVTPEHMREMLDKAAQDSRIKAVVLRVNSPGGTAAASEEIAAYVKAFKKPVIVSISDVGASGAYMVSSQADEIWAMPATAVGSVGVITEIPDASKLLDKVGVDFQVITAGKYKDAGSPYRKLTAEERALLQGDVDDVYDQFIDLVAAGRRMERSEVESLATGWAWNGRQATKLGLVDHIGTYQDALDAAAKAGGIRGRYETVVLEDEFRNWLSGILGVVRGLDPVSAATGGSNAGPAVPR